MKLILGSALHLLQSAYAVSGWLHAVSARQVTAELQPAQLVENFHQLSPAQYGGQRHVRVRFESQISPAGAPISIMPDLPGMVLVHHRRWSDKCPIAAASSSAPCVGFHANAVRHHFRPGWR